MSASALVTVILAGRLVVAQSDLLATTRAHGAPQSAHTPRSLVPARLHGSHELRRERGEVGLPEAVRGDLPDVAEVGSGCSSAS